MIPEILTNNDLRETYYRQVIEPTFQKIEPFFQAWIERGVAPVLKLCQRAFQRGFGITHIRRGREIQRQDQIAALEAEAEARHHAELEQAVARHPGEETDDQVAALAQLQRLAAGEGPAPAAGATRKAAPRIGRNDPCPCGSGMKFKKCHGALLEEEGASDDEAEEEQPRA